MTPKATLTPKGKFFFALLGAAGLCICIALYVPNRQAPGPAPAPDPQAQRVFTQMSLLAEKQKAHATDEARAEIKRRIDIMLKGGILRRIEPASHKAWVTPLAWAIADAQAKENLTKIMAIYCSPDYPEIDIYDAQTARKIASYGPWQGFKVY